MLVNEAPWLTRKVEMTIMVTMFLIFLSFDFMKCRSNYTRGCAASDFTFCEGNGDASWCDDVVVTPPTPEERTRCARISHNSSNLLVHVLNVGPPTNARTAGSIAPLVALELDKRLKGEMLANATGSLLNAGVFDALRDDIGLSIPQTEENTSVLHRLKVSYSYDTVVVLSRSTLLKDIESALPFSSGHFSLQRYLPGLKRALDGVPSQTYTIMKSKDAGCGRVFLIVLVVVTPGIDVAWANTNPVVAPETLINAQLQVRKTVSQYLRKRRQYALVLNDVWYIGIPIGYPVPESNNSSIAMSNTTRTGDVYVSMPHLGEIFCAGSKKAKVCCERCGLYQKRLSSYLSANTRLQQLTDGGADAGRRVGRHTILLSYRYHFPGWSVSGNSGWQDCISMSSAGERHMARSIVKSLFVSPGKDGDVRSAADKKEEEEESR